MKQIYEGILTLINWDERQIKRLRRGNKDAQERCYVEFSPQVYTAILKICGNRDTANELLHDSFIDVFTEINTYNEEYVFIAWVKRIAINNTINYVKRHQNSKRILTLIDRPNIKDYCYSDDNLLDKLLATLTPENRAIIWLYIVEQFTHKEISKLLDKSESYSKSIVSRSLKSLRKSAEVLTR